MDHDLQDPERREEKLSGEIDYGIRQCRVTLRGCAFFGTLE